MQILNPCRKCILKSMCSVICKQKVDHKLTIESLHENIVWWTITATIVGLFVGMTIDKLKQ